MHDWVDYLCKLEVQHNELRDIAVTVILTAPSQSQLLQSLSADKLILTHQCSFCMPYMKVKQHKQRIQVTLDQNSSQLNVCM